jgi:hypothetical protein
MFQKACVGFPQFPCTRPWSGSKLGSFRPVNRFSECPLLEHGMVCDSIEHKQPFSTFEAGTANLIRNCGKEDWRRVPPGHFTFGVNQNGPQSASATKLASCSCRSNQFLGSLPYCRGGRRIPRGNQSPYPRSPGQRRPGSCLPAGRGKAKAMALPQCRSAPVDAVAPQRSGPCRLRRFR